MYGDREDTPNRMVHEIASAEDIHLSLVARFMAILDRMSTKSFTGESEVELNFYD